MEPEDAVEPELRRTGAGLALSAFEDEVPTEVYAAAMATEPEASIDAFEPEPVFDSRHGNAAASSHTVVASLLGFGQAVTSASLGDIDVLLRQMDETLLMIRSVRAKAA